MSKTDPILQGLLAEFDEKAKGKMPSDMTLVTISRPEWENFLEEVKSFITSVVHRTREETKKEYGGCDKCYGKGYSTQMSQLIGAEDFGGDGFQEKPKVGMNFCSCGRGEQLKDLIALREKK